MSGRYSFLILLLALSGCATRELPPVSVYALHPSAGSPPPAERRGRATLKLAPLHGIQPFTTTGMLYTEHGTDLNRFAFSRWADAPTRMLQPILVEALERSGLFNAVLPPGSAFRGDLSLEGTLLDFSLHFDGSRPRAVAEVRFLLLDDVRRRVVASRLFHSEVPIAKADAEEAASALERATAEISRKLIHWLKPLVEQRRRPPHDSTAGS